MTTAARTLSPYAPIVTREGRQTQVLIDYFISLQADPVFLLANLPAPVKGGRIYVDDATGGGCPCYGDGTNWRRYSDNQIVT